MWDLEFHLYQKWGELLPPLQLVVMFYSNGLEGKRIRGVRRLPTRFGHWAGLQLPLGH